MLPIFLLEIPSGFIADKYGRKTIYLLSIALMISGFATIGFSSLMWLIFIGQALYGAATALMSGTIDADLIYLIKKNEPTLLKRAQWKLDITSTIGALFGGIIGSFIYSETKEWFYLFPVICFVIVFILIFSTWEKVETNFTNTPLSEYYKHFKQDSKKFFTSKIVLIAICFMFASQLFVQPFYNFWQQVYSDKKIPVKYFGLIYGLFQAITLIGTIVFAKIKNHNKWFEYLFLLVGFALAIMALIFLRSLSFALIFPLFMIPLNMASNSNSYRVNKVMTTEHISSQTSIISTWTRLFSIVALLISFALSKAISVENIFYVVTPIMLMILLVSTVFTKEKNEKVNT